ncbi:MAG: tRNA adenosine(34) deaminase TadA [Deltaproteobacteria bacterium]|nr:tRNA adenosine(34) deaminase TadA [Deltaproteobacteria bacterium]
MSPDPHHYMGLALEEAARGYAQGEVPVGAVVVDTNGRVLSRAYNAPIACNDPTAHAEILAIRQAASELGNYRLTGSTLYVTLEPCPMCLGAMLHARLSKLVFGAPDPKWGAAGGVVDLTRVSGFNHYIVVIGGVRVEECAEILRRFFRERRQEKQQGFRGEVPKRP